MNYQKCHGCKGKKKLGVLPTLEGLVFSSLKEDLPGDGRKGGPLKGLVGTSLFSKDSKGRADPGKTGSRSLSED